MRYLLIILLSCLFTCGWAQDTVQLKDAHIPIQLLPVEVIGSPAWAGQDAPLAVSTLSRKQLDLTYANAEPSFLLQSTPNVSMYSDAGSYWGYSYFRLRGMDQTRINFTLDGVPLSEPEDQGFYFSNFDDLLASVRSIQIQRGVGVSTQGVAAYAGSVHLASPTLSRKKAWEASAGYGSFNSYRVSGSYQTGRIGDWSLYARASRTGSDGFKEHSDHQGGSAFLHTGWTKSKGILTLTAFWGRQQNQMAWLGVHPDILRENPEANANSEQERDDFQQGLAKLQYTHLFNRHLSWSSSVYYSRVVGDYDFDLNNFLGLPSTEELYNYDFNSHLTGMLSFLRWEKNDWQLQTGLHGNLYQRTHLGSERSLGQLYENTGFKDELSFFLRGERALGDWRLRLEGQYRYTDFAYEGAVPLADLSWDFFNYKASLSYAVAENGLAYLSFGRTQREPTRNDLFGGNDDLLADSLGQALTFVQDPEQVQDLELGYKWTNRQWQVALNAYYLSFDNEIVLNGQFGPNGLPLRAKVAESFRSGLEVEAAYRPQQNWTLRHNSAFSRNQIKDQGFTIEPILTPRVLVNQGVFYAKGPWSVGLEARYQGPTFIDFANDYELDGFFTLNAHLQRQLGPVQLKAQVFNLTNASYFGNGQLDIFGQPAYHRQAPLHVWLAATWRGGEQ